MDLSENISNKLELFKEEIRASLKEINLSDITLFDDRIIKIILSNELQKKQKNTSDALREYEKEKWGNLKERFLISKTQNLAQLKNEFYGDKEICMLVGKKLFQSSVGYYHKLVADLISLIIGQLTKDTSCNIIEFGCGFGSTLLEVCVKLSRQKVDIIKVFGTDISSSGLFLCDRLATDLNLNFTGITHDFSLRTQQSNIKEEKNVSNIGFSHFSLASITSYDFDVIESLFDFGKLDYFVMLEPMLKTNEEARNIFDCLTEAHLKSNSYNTQLSDFQKNNKNKNYQNIFTTGPILGSSGSTGLTLAIFKKRQNS